MATFTLTGRTPLRKKPPTAIITTDKEFTVIGAVVSLDGRASIEPDHNELSYRFSFLSVPIGSKVALEGFRRLDDSGGAVSFSPDVTGSYSIGLVVSNGSFDSEMATLAIDVRAMMVPHARGIVPDGKFIWSYLRDVWSQVDGKEFFETLWSSLIQISGGEMLKLYQTDFNKSIADIQDLYQRRWLPYEPRLSIIADDVSFFLGNHAVGHAASTGSAGEFGLAVILGDDELVVVQGVLRPDLAWRTIDLLYSEDPLNVGRYTISGLTSKANGFRLSAKLHSSPTTSEPPALSDFIVKDVVFHFTAGSKLWNVSSTRRYDFIMSDVLGFPVFKGQAGEELIPVAVGDVVNVLTGPNAGLYRITGKSGAYITVDRVPPADSDDAKANIYRPVGFSIEPLLADLSDTVTIPLAEAGDLSALAPGRLLVVNGEAHVVTRVSVDTTQRVATVAVALDSTSLVPGIGGLTWRSPHTVVSKSQDFEALGVCTGDTFIMSLSDDSGMTVDLPFQVQGVVGHRVGVVLSDQPLNDYAVPEVSPSIFMAIASRFGLRSVSLLPDGTVALQDEASDLVTAAKSVFFKKTYWNSELTPETPIVVGKRTFFLSPKAVIRNRRVPVDATVRSIPALQEYIRQPQVEVGEDGAVHMVRGDQRFLLPREPVVLAENSGYVVDGAVAFNGNLTFRSGTDILDADCGDFVDMGLVAGDVFHIEDPLLFQGDYTIVSVLSRNRLKLSRVVPKYPLADFVTARVTIRRKTTGHFVRFIPGLFSAAKPAPDRLWAEITFFDNGANIERNFGVLVGLRQSDIEDVSANATYRQAVAGLMYAYVSGAAVDKIRLGVSLLLGLPFTEKRGIIRSIDPDYRLDSSGAAVTGRILVEDLNDDGTPSGLMRIYTFPIDQASSDLSGVDTNPATGRAYQVGDEVAAFSSLAKGVQLLDFTGSSAGLSGRALLQRYHSIRVRINDNIFKPKEIELVSQFLRKITPSYIALFISSSSEFFDGVSVADKLVMKVGSVRGDAWSPFTDLVGLSSPAMPFFDAKSNGGIPLMKWDNPPFELRRAGRTMLVQGTSTDPVGTYLAVPDGGLVSPRNNHEIFEPPLCEVGDGLVLVGNLHEGFYPDIEVRSDTLLFLPDVILSDVGPMHYAVVRPVSAEPLEDQVVSFQNSTFADTVTGGSYDYSLVTLFDGRLRTRGIVPGDLAILFKGGTFSKHVVMGMAGPNAPFPNVVESFDPPWNRVALSPQVPNGVDNTWSIAFVRRQFMQREMFAGTPVTISDGPAGTSLLAPAASLAVMMGVAEVGDQVLFDDAEQTTVTIIDPLTFKTTHAGSLVSAGATLVKKGFSSTPVMGIGSLVRGITDHVTTKLI